MVSTITHRWDRGAITTLSTVTRITANRIKYVNHGFVITLTASGPRSKMTKFRVLALMMIEIRKLEHLRQLEAGLVLTSTEDRASIQHKIDAVMEEIACLNREVEQCKARQVFA